MYISVSDIHLPEDVLVRLTDDEGAGSVNTARLDAAIAAAQAIVDSSLSRLYDVPLATAPELVKKLTHDIAVYYLYIRVGSLPDEVRAAHEYSGKVLDRLAEGAVLLEAARPGDVSGMYGQDREFSREYMEGF